MADGDTTFAYEVQTPAGQALSGTLAIKDLAAARDALAALSLRVISLTPVEVERKRPGVLKGEDFLAFNEQLAHLTATGLPVEQGLRLIAQDMRSGRLASTVRAIAEELEKGASLEAAFEQHRTKFPPLYGRLMSAGVKSNNLSGILFNLGRHLELVARVRGALWRAAAYPLTVLVGLLLVLLLLSEYVLPQFAKIFEDFRTALPTLTALLMAAAPYLPVIAVTLLVMAVAVPVIWQLLRVNGYQQYVADYAVLPLPIIGPVLRANLAARWCDALGLGISAGLDLPNAIGLASDAVASPRVTVESEKLIGLLAAGQTLDQYPGSLVIPVTVTTTLHLAAQQHDLPQALRSLSEMYQEQANHKVTLLPTVITPLLMLVMACGLGVTIIALFLPLVKLIQSVSGGSGF